MLTIIMIAFPMFWKKIVVSANESSRLFRFSIFYQCVTKHARCHSFSKIMSDKKKNCFPYDHLFGFDDDDDDDDELFL